MGAGELKTNNFLTFPTSEDPPRSEVLLTGHVMGSAVGNVIIDWQTVAREQGTAIIIKRDVENGTSFLVAESGVYAMFTNVSTNNSAGGFAVGFSVDAPDLTVAYTSLEQKYKLTGGMLSEILADPTVTVTTFAPLKAGQVVRVHTNGPTLTAADNNFQWVQICKVSG